MFTYVMQILNYILTSNHILYHCIIFNPYLLINSLLIGFGIIFKKSWTLYSRQKRLLVFLHTILYAVSYHGDYRNFIKEKTYLFAKWFLSLIYSITYSWYSKTIGNEWWSLIDSFLLRFSFSNITFENVNQKESRILFEEKKP